MRPIIFSLALTITFFTNAQERNFKFGKVSKEEVSQKEHPLEKDAEAAILYKNERVFYDYDAQQGFRTIRNVHYRIKIYNKSGLDWGTIEVPLYTNNSGEERISSVKGYTYNMVNGKLQEAKLKKDGIFKENVNRYRNKASIVMPEVKEGSIIELQYSVSSDFAANLDVFQFQYGIPMDKVDVSVEIPEYFVFKRYGKGFYPISIQQTKKSRKIQYNYKPEFQAGGNNTAQMRELEFFENVYQVNTENIPSLKEVAYTDNIDNYRCAIKFELASTQFPSTPYKNYSLTWEDVAETIYKSDEFGGELNKSRLIKEIVDDMKSKNQDNGQLMSSIFDYIKSNLTWNQYYGKYCENGIRKTLSEKTGNVADLNLTLVTMLKYAGFKANPVLVSTKSHGIPLFPTREGFNYVIAAVETGNEMIFMDATEKMGAIGVLPLRAMNWNGRLVREDGTSTEVKLAPKKHAKKVTFISADIFSDGHTEGKIRTQLTQNFAFDYRDSHQGEDLDDIMDAMEERFVEMEIDELDLKNRKDCTKPIVESCHFVKESQIESISGKLYFKPALFMAIKENPFKMDKREYPVDFGYPRSNKLTINFKIPEGYVIESVPENMTIGLPDGMGTFKYIIRQQGNQLQFSSSTDINIGILPPSYYGSLKEFFNQIVVKQGENIVLTRA